VKAQPPLGEMLRLYRVTRRLSLRDLTPQIGISSATLCRIEAGKALDAGTMLKLWTWMLTGHPQPEEPR
jgi:hypothetical protein